ncbi:MAG: hypothetical protein QXD48_03875 [Candidatus Aenigmatarchaeota archaeon]
MFIKTIIIWPRGNGMSEDNMMFVGKMKILRTTVNNRIGMKNNAENPAIEDPANIEDIIIMPIKIKKSLFVMTFKNP